LSKDDNRLSFRDNPMLPLRTMVTAGWPDYLLPYQSQSADPREDEMAVIPLAIVAASIGASIYMAFIWSPQRKP
jgi:hypothetical protein